MSYMELMAGGGMRVGEVLKLTPNDLNDQKHDLRRHAATYASMTGVPIEIVSKVILRHSNPSTTQRYLGKITDGEATRWIENLYG
jgi:integrase